MDALRVHAFDEGIRLDVIEPPQPGPGEARVRVQCCGVSFVDLLVTGGAYQVRPPLPYIGGSEFAGVVEALGEGVAPGLAIGDRVAGSSAGGVWAQFLCVPAAALHRVDAQVPIEEAAVLAVPYGTALYALRERGRLQPDETLLVLGASGAVGHAAVQLGKIVGARVIAAASTAAKRAAVREAGADGIVAIEEPGWKEQVKALTSPRSTDLVFDPVGGEVTDAAFRTLGWGGRHLMVGFACGEIGSLRSNLAIVKGASLVGVDFRQCAEREPAKAGRLMEDVFALHRAGRIRPRIAAGFALSEFDRAVACVRDRATLGRVVLFP